MVNQQSQSAPPTIHSLFLLSLFLLFFLLLTSVPLLLLAVILPSLVILFIYFLVTLALTPVVCYLFFPFLHFISMIALFSSLFYLLSLFLSFSLLSLFLSLLSPPPLSPSSHSQLLLPRFILFPFNNSNFHFTETNNDVWKYSLSDSAWTFVSSAGMGVDAPENQIDPTMWSNETVIWLYDGSNNSMFLFVFMYF
jgi:hypothetical protein